MENSCRHFETTGSHARRAWLLLLVFGLIWPASASAQEDATAFQAAVALEKVLIDAIAKSEKSVVAIARVRKPALAHRGPDNLRFPSAAPDTNPTDPEFIPNEFGTGVVVDRRGLILTNYHLLGEVGSNLYYVTTTTRKVYKAEIKAADTWSDLAVLQIKTNDLEPITFGDAKQLKKGQLVVALGNPYAIARDGQVSASWGMISNISRKAGPKPAESARVGKETMHHYGTLIQTDAKLNLGTSGGALLNLKGEMIGLTTSLAAAAGYEKAAGYAIPADDAFKRIVDTLKSGREVEYGFLGVAPENLSNVMRLQGKQGVFVREVVQGTPAATFGIRPRDIITHVDGHRLHDADSLMLLVGREPVESTVNLTVDRDDRVVHQRVKLTKKFVLASRKSVVTEPAPSWRGIRVEFPSAMPDFKNRSDFGEVDPAGCVVIVEVEKDSPAWKGELRRGMFVTHVGETRVSSPREFHTAAGNEQGAVRLHMSGQFGQRPIHLIHP